MMLSELIRIGDIVYFRNGQCAEVGNISFQILDQYYSRVDSMLKTKITGFECPSNHDYDIVRVTRPVYETIFQTEELEKGDKHHVHSHR